MLHLGPLRRRRHVRRGEGIARNAARERIGVGGQIKGSPAEKSLQQTQRLRQLLEEADSVAWNGIGAWDRRTGSAHGIGAWDRRMALSVRIVRSHWVWTPLGVDPSGCESHWVWIPLGVDPLASQQILL